MRVLIVDSADPEFFIAHADVSLLGDLHGRPETADTALHDELSFFHAMTERIRTLPKATIAVIEGICRGGGCEFAMAFDIRFAALGTTVLGHPEVSVGIIPGARRAGCSGRSSTPAPRPETSSGAPRRNRPRLSPGSVRRRQR
ncbi:Fatty acid oxidation complex subunit alpha [Mycobacterium persicum]|uniref:Fatty acid oxidation complex subunit alpha n=1 Tax=Mycobacterium persicum TaxID=1487726 RepID=A0AB38UMA6_9MYCO|nr:Fatty acid oxidation complex subunit alpha [Mycobacterium persicum]VAZ81758.1 Fatty acid oxidation complex subunit alpha [Mycobacterium persicum]VAZ87343.1 Fatty acid oxidation complex subunit alpha [Mycobacterium persicum]